jgi:hypothetical protein
MLNDRDAPLKRIEKNVYKSQAFEAGDEKSFLVWAWVRWIFPHS